MEFLQKRIYQITKFVITGGTGSTKVVPQDGSYTKPIDVYLGWTGATGGTGYTKIPDTGATYNVKICLTQESEDIGFFSAYPLTGCTGTTNDVDYSGYAYVPYVVTGGCTSRLNELKKYAVNVPFNQQYVGSGSLTVDGVDFTHSIGNIIVYYLGGIRFVDISGTTGTTFSFITLGIKNPNFINVPYYKDPKKENIISNPKIDNDVFIIRQALSAFEKNYRLESIKSMIDLETYAGGKYFNIVKNT